jgi:hypothetical protein
MGFQDFENFRSRHPAIRTTGLLTFALASLSPAEHISVCWTQQPEVPISGVRLSDRLHRKAHSGAGRGRRSRHNTPRFR